MRMLSKTCASRQRRKPGKPCYCHSKLITTFGALGTLVWPELGGHSPNAARLIGFIIGLLGAALTAFALIMVRSLNNTESPGSIAFYFAVASMAAGLLTLPWGWTQPDSWTLALLVGAGLLGGLAHIAMTLAFRYAEASRIAPFEYVALLWPVLADLLIFKVAFSTSFLFALPLVLGGAALAAAEKNVTKRKYSL